jgi:hypothetical protein
MQNNQHSTDIGSGTTEVLERTDATTGPSNGTHPGEGGQQSGSRASGTKMSYKFQRLREKLREAIRSGEFAGKLPGERALAKRFHVNAKTLSKALTDLAAEGLLDRSIGRGTYVKGTAPQPSAHGRWLVLCDAGQAEGCLVARLKRANEHLHVVSGPGEVGRMRPSFLNQFDAVIDMAGGTPESLLRDLVVRNVPVVVVGREPRTYSTHAVLADAALGATRLVRNLLLAGHRRLAAVEPPGSTVVTLALRQAAARYAPAMNGDSSDAVVESFTPEESASLVSPADWAGATGGPGGVTAVVCDSAASAREVRKALQQHGTQIPGDVCLAAVGCACDLADCDSAGCGYPCSGYFVSCQQIVDAIVGLLTDTPSRPTTLWLAGQFVDIGTIQGGCNDTALHGPVVHPAENVASPLVPIGSLRLGTVPM